MYGAIIGTAMFILAENYLEALMGMASKATANAGIPVLTDLLHPDRWLLWLGLLFIASVTSSTFGVVDRSYAEELIQMAGTSPAIFQLQTVDAQLSRLSSG